MQDHLPSLLSFEPGKFRTQNNRLWIKIQNSIAIWKASKSSWSKPAIPPCAFNEERVNGKRMLCSQVSRRCKRAWARSKPKSFGAGCSCPCRNPFFRSFLDENKQLFVFFWSMLKIKISISIQRDEDLADQHFQLQLTSFCFRTSLALGRELFKGALRIARWTLVFCCAMMGKPKNTCRSDRVMREFREKLTCGRKFKIEIKDYRIISVTLQ